MNTKITFTYEGIDYTLEYNRMSVKALENNGFSLEEFSKKPMVNIEMAFAGAFIKNHRKTSQKTIDEIYHLFKDKDSLIETISKMISECYESLMDEPEDNEGNIEWEVVGLKPKKTNKE